MRTLNFNGSVLGAHLQRIQCQIFGTTDHAQLQQKLRIFSPEMQWPFYQLKLVYLKLEPTFENQPHRLYLKERLPRLGVIKISERKYLLHSDRAVFSSGTEDKYLNSSK